MGNFLYGVAAPSLQGTFPDRQHAPIVGQQLLFDAGISHAIGLDLLSPEFPACHRPFEQMAVMAMPKTPVHKNNGMVLPNNKIGLSRQSLVMQAVTDILRKERLSYLKFWCGILPLDAGHHPAARFPVDDVGHQPTSRSCG